jgi:integrase
MQDDIRPPPAPVRPGDDRAVSDALAALGLDPECTGPVDPALRAALLRLPGDWGAAYAPQTVTARATDLRRFFEWCRVEGRAPLAEASGLAPHLEDWMVSAAGHLGPQSFRRTAAHLVAFLKGLGLPETAVDHRRRMVVRSQNRAARDRQTDRREAPGRRRLTAPDIRRIETGILEARISAAMRTRDLAIFVLMSELLLRRDDVRNFRLLDWDREAGELTIRHAKTDQEGRGVRYALSDKATACLEDWLQISGLGDIADPDRRATTPIFTALHKSGGICRGAGGVIVPLTGRSIARILSGHADRVGIAGVSGHTPRRSVARLMHLGGVPDAEIQEAGRWSSVEVMRSYVGLTPARRGAGAILEAAGK